MKAKLLFFNTNKLIIIIILIFFCLISVSSNSKKIIHKFNNISDVTFSDESDIVIFKNSYLYGKPGQPLLPYTNIKILLPLDADFSSININLDNLEEVIFSKKVNILPAQPPIYDGTPTWPTGSNIVDGIDMDVYSVDSYSPSKYIKTSCTGKLRQWKIVEITLVPYQYNPIQKRLKKLVNAEIVIEYKVIDTVIRSSLKTLNKKNITPIEVKTMDKVKNMVVNFLDVNSTYGDTLLFQPSKSAVETITGNSKYVIIT
ncbi:MAG: hypothetical protein KAT05_14190, partial [Spirochaetes bacterium]|nr:hypothetical protein [Spirochaetota bacterium]